MRSGARALCTGMMLMIVFASMGALARTSSMCTDDEQTLVRAGNAFATDLYTSRNGSLSISPCSIPSALVRTPATFGH